MANRFVKTNQVKKYLNEKGVRVSKELLGDLENLVVQSLDAVVGAKTASAVDNKD